MSLGQAPRHLENGATAPRASSRPQNIQTRLGKLDNEGRFVIDFVFPVLCTQLIVSRCSVIQDSVANALRRLLRERCDDLFNPAPFLFVAAVEETVRIKEEDVPLPHKCNFSHVRRSDPTLAKLHRDIAVTIRMILRDLKSQGEELRNAGLANFHKSLILCRKNQRWRMAEVHETEMPVRPNLPVKQSGNFTCSCVYYASQSIPGRR